MTGINKNSLKKLKKKKIKIGNLTYKKNNKIKKNVPNLKMKIKKNSFKKD